MAVPEQSIQSLLEVAGQRERQSRQRAILYTAIPILLAIALVVFTALQIQKLGRVQTDLSSTEKKLELANTQLSQSQQQIATSQKTLDELKTRLEQTQGDYQKAVSELDAAQIKLDQANLDLEQTRQDAEALQRRVDELEQQLDDLADQLYQASTFKQYEVSISLEAVKEVALPPVQMDLFFELLDLQFSAVRFDPTGSSSRDGINSPNFVVAMLEKYELLPINYDFRLKPWEQLSHTPSPENGDLVFYESGYTMFYFNVPEEFVIGMTPVGILTLQPDFAPILGYLDVEYP